MASENVAQQALELLDVAKSGGIVVVRDSEDIWVCSEAAWDAALVKLSAAPYDAPCVDDEAGTGVAAARGHLFASVAAPVLSLHGTSRGAYLALVDLTQLAIAAGLLDVYLARRALARIRT